MFNKVLIANRGEIVCRISRTLHRLGVGSVGIYSPADRDSLHLQAVDQAFNLGSDTVLESYLNQDAIIRIIEASGAQAVHPGYGFLSENAAFAELLSGHGIIFVGPRPEHLRTFGLKHEARALAEAAGVNLLPGCPPLADVDSALVAAEAIGYPVMLKSSAGGGGIGMRRCHSPHDLEASFETVTRLASGNFGNASVFLEKYVTNPRHVEVQAFGDGQGDVITIGDRDCSLQRRHQKVVEESPAPNLPDRVRAEIHDQARALLAHVDYESAGTVEFLYDADAQACYFLEVNTRLQVEHGITELTHGVDLVEAMLAQAAGDLTSLAALNRSTRPNGHAIQARVYAEDPNNDFRPTPGQLVQVSLPKSDRIRIDTWIESGVQVPSYYDPLLAKVMYHGSDRASAIAGLYDALGDMALHGIETNLGYLRQALNTPSFNSASMTTHSLESMDYTPCSVDVLEGGAYTTLQSWPGRQGYWSVGVPPSGPMDDLSFRLGNQMLGNEPSAVGLEIVLKGPKLRFNTAATVVITGPGAQIDVDGLPADCFEIIHINPGQTLTIGKVTDGARAYLLIGNGFDVPEELGSPATFTLGRMGGLNGSTLKSGDVIHLCPAEGPATVPASTPARIERPDYGARNEIHIMMGPHTAPDYFTDQDIDTLLAATWTVHYNSSRTGIRLMGPQPTWTRADGGEAGLHPSNIHDNAYAFGSIDFTGDMPVILGPDGPSLGGFVCPGVVINADRWKLGQLVGGDQIRFVAVTEPAARRASEQRSAYLRDLTGFSGNTTASRPLSPVITGKQTGLQMDDCTIRHAGEEWILVEFGPPMLDIELHLKVHALKRMIDDTGLPGIVELTPGIRSLQIRFEVRRWSSEKLAAVMVDLIENIDDEIGLVESRVVHLPLSWDDPACREAISRYTQGVRPDAPWCPDNIEFIRRINGLDTVQDVKDIVLDANYLVMGLGDVYLGAPVATPLDPRQRLVTTKYNPARTWTAENSVGIGGSYLCIYGMEGPGGYQFVGRTLQVWNRYRRGRAFDEHWLLRGFDQIRFHEVDAAELAELREAFPRGGHEIEIETTRFDLSSYRQFLTSEKQTIDEFSTRRKAAFDDELQRWREQGLFTFDTGADTGPSQPMEVIDNAVESPMAGSVWSIQVKEGQPVQNNDVLLVLEAMKSEFEVRAPSEGAVKLLVKPGQQVSAGQALVVIES